MRICLLLLLLIPLASAMFFDAPTNLFSGTTKRAKKSYAPLSESKAKQYLETFGYMKPPGNRTEEGVVGGKHKRAVADTKNQLTSAIRTFQQFNGLKPTGVLDLRTRQKMSAPRCGQPDIEFMTSGSSAFKWSKTDLTFSIDSWSRDMPKAAIRKAIEDAYAMWAEVTPLTFTEEDPGKGDIKIRFGKGKHGDMWPFDGKGGVLAHATMPESGTLHFDDDENWAYLDEKKIASDSYTDFFAVAIHECGHTLGLSHSRDENSIMAPFYQQTVDDEGTYNAPTLTDADTKSIQEIYGKADGEEEAEGEEEESEDGETEGGGEEANAEEEEGEEEETTDGKNRADGKVQRRKRGTEKIKTTRSQKSAAISTTDR